jgi:putative ATP-binding cassette transporter
VITVAVYSAIVTIVMMGIGSSLLKGITGKNAAEAQFRSIASHLREQGETATPSLTPRQDTDGLGNALAEVIARWRTLCLQLMRTTLISQGNLLVAPVIAWVLCAPKYLVGTMSLGEVAQAAAAFVTVQAALNWLVDNFPGLADCLSSINRVGSLLVALDESEPTGDAPPASRE